VLEIERGHTRFHPVENSLWKRLHTCPKTDYRTIMIDRVIPDIVKTWAVKSKGILQSE
jgi:hypothetical protein